jgi:sugar lactone lactonase YvrE
MTAAPHELTAGLRPLPRCRRRCWASRRSGTPTSARCTGATSPAKRAAPLAPGTGAHRHWDFAQRAGCCAPLPGGACCWRCATACGASTPPTGQRQRLAAPPYDPAHERFNDGKADPQGRFWVGTIYEPRSRRWPRCTAGPAAADRMAGGITVSNGLAFSPDGRTMYWSDTKAHVIYAFDFDGGRRQPVAAARVRAVPAKRRARTWPHYGGRPDGAAVDAEGAYWVAMFEGQRLLRLAPDGRVLQQLPLPVRCPTMPCFGGADLRTLFVTTARENRPADELARSPGRLRAAAARRRAGLPVNFARAWA